MIFLFSAAFGVVLGPTQFSVQWELEALLLEEKQPGHEAHLSPLSSTEIKNVWSYTSTLHDVVLNSHSDFIFTFMHSITILAC